VTTPIALLLAALSGVLYFTGFIGFDQWYLEWIALVPLLVVLDGIHSSRRAFFISWFMGYVTHLGGYYWLVHLLMEFGELPWPLAFLGYLLICLQQSAQLALFGWLAWKLKQRFGWAIGWCAPIALIAAEFVYPQILFTSYTANSQAWIPALIQISDLGGVLALSGVIALVNGAIAQLILTRRQQAWPRAIVLSASGVLLFTLGYGLLRMQQIDARDAATEKLKVAMIQGNIGGSEKHLRGAAGIVRYREMTDAVAQTPGLGAIVWPEGAFDDLVGPNANLTGLVASEVKLPMIVGAVRIDTAPAARNAETRYWNSLLAVAPGGKVIAHYDKVKLLLFGESLPFYDTFPGFYKWLLDIGILPYVSAFSAGTSYEPLPLGRYRISADVCYEDILPRQIRALMGPIDAAGTRPHAMFNGTNDSWYGPVEPRIHMALSVFRAVEHRRWLIRATVTGISAFIDSNGRVVDRSDFEVPETLVRDVPMVVGGATLYGIIGDALGWLAVLVVLVALIGWRRIRA
jgi:apolipoprotein N-acyltransferase